MGQNGPRALTVRGNIIEQQCARMDLWMIGVWQMNQEVISEWRTEVRRACVSDLPHEVDSQEVSGAPC